MGKVDAYVHKYKLRNVYTPVYICIVMKLCLQIWTVVYFFLFVIIYGNVKCLRTSKDGLVIIFHTSCLCNLNSIVPRAHSPRDRALTKNHSPPLSSINFKFDQIS